MIITKESNRVILEMTPDNALELMHQLVDLLRASNTASATLPASERTERTSTGFGPSCLTVLIKR